MNPLLDIEKIFKMFTVNPLPKTIFSSIEHALAKTIVFLALKASSGSEPAQLKTCFVTSNFPTHTEKQLI